MSGTITKILLIEDSPTDASLVRNFLGKITTETFELVETELIEEAINYLKTARFDAILLDLSLPDSWGLNSLREVKKIAPKIPVIVLTGIEDKVSALAALREGAQDYLIKDSISADLLVKSIRYAIERQQNAEQLRCSEARYRGVVEDQTELVCRFLLDKTLTFVNQSYCRYFALAKKNIAKQNLKIAIFPEDIPIFQAHLNSLNRKKKNTTLEFRVIAPEGEICWQQWNIRAIFQDTNIVEFQAVGRDISDRKQAELDKARLIASLHESETRFRTMANTAPVLIWLSDANGQATFFNQSWLDFTGYTLEEALIHGWLAKIHPEERLQCLDDYNLARKKRCQNQTEYRLLHKDGKYRWLLSTTVPTFNNKGQFAGFISSCIDISHRKQAEELIARQAELDRIEAQIIQSIHESLMLETIAKTAVTTINQFLTVERLSIIKFTVLEAIEVLATTTKLEQELDRNYLAKSKQFKLNWQTHSAKLAQGHIVFVEQEPESTSTQHSLSFCSQLLIPIFVQKQLWGLLVAEPFSPSRAWYSQETKLLERIAVQLGIAIQKSELYQQVEQLAVIDSLTGIANRRKFDRYLAKEWRRLAREKTPLSVILGDIDYFKLYNDTYGHQAGDRCLRNVAQAIARAVKRPADLAARYGGEELAIILPNTDIEGAYQVAHRISMNVRALQIPHINSPIDIYLTMSIGVASYVPTPSSYPKTLISSADRALYRAKELGRDRIVIDTGYTDRTLNAK